MFKRIDSISFCSHRLILQFLTYSLSTSIVNMKSAGQKGGRQKSARAQTPSATVTIPLEKQNVATNNARQDVMASGSSLLATYQKPPENIQFITSSVGAPCVFPPPNQQMTCSLWSLQSSWIQASQQQHNWFTSPQKQQAGGTSTQALPHYNTSSQLLHLEQPGVHSNHPYSPSPAGTSPWSNNNPFVVTKLTKKIKKCIGCRVEFRSPLGPPFTGLVIRHFERDHYKDKFGQDHISNEANRYYHCNVECIKFRHPQFYSGLIIVEWSELDPVQANFIKQMFEL